MTLPPVGAAVKVRKYPSQDTGACINAAAAAAQQFRPLYYDLSGRIVYSKNYKTGKTKKNIVESPAQPATILKS